MLSLFFEEEITETGMMNEAEKQLKKEKQHPWGRKTNNADSSTGRYWSSNSQTQIQKTRSTKRSGTKSKPENISTVSEKSWIRL